MADKKTIKKNPNLIAHTHCRGCGEHFRAVNTLIDLGSKDSAGKSNWTCARCEARKHVQAGNLVVVKCPSCTDLDRLECGDCAGYGSVRVPEGALPVYSPKQRVLTEG